MKISGVGINLIQEFEGCKLKAYLCPAGKITIGYGHTGSELRMTDEVTKERALEILKIDLKWVEDVINRRVYVPLKQNQFDALCSLVFNIGAANFSSSSVLRVLNARQYDEVPAMMALWNKITVNGKKVVSAGLVRRRQAEGELWLCDFSDKQHPMPQEVAPPDSGKTSLFSRLLGRKN